MTETALLRTDLNLLVVLHALLSERSVSRAADRIHRSQSATSHALARLRTLFDDPLLVRSGSDMVPTPLALRLEPTLAGLMTTAADLLEPTPTFSPDTSDRRFTVALPDVLPGLAAHVVEQVCSAGPSLRVELSLATPGVLDRVIGGGRDAAITFGGVERSDLASERLTSVRWIVCMRGGHPLEKRLDTDTWASARHVVIGASLDSGAPDRVARAAAALGIPQRASIVAVPTFADLRHVVAETDAIATIPETALPAAGAGLVTLPVPFPIEPIDLALYWPARLDGDPANRWIRNVVRESHRRHTTAGSST